MLFKKVIFTKFKNNQKNAMSYTKLIVLLLCLNVMDIYSQALSNPLDPIPYDLNKDFVGIFAGPGLNFQSGSYNVQCTSCEFSSGNGFGYTVGLLYESSLSVDFLLGAMVYYDYIGINSEYLLVSSRPYISPATGETELINIAFNQSAEASFATLSFAPYIKLYLFGKFYFRLGGAVGMPIQYNIIHNEKLAQRTAITKDGTVVEIEQLENSELENGEFPEVNSPIISILPALGFDFFHKDKLYGGLTFQQNIPLTPVSNFGKDFMINSWRVLFELRYDITVDNRKYK